MKIAQTIIDYIFPPTCLLCNSFVDKQGTLCNICWVDVTFCPTSVCHICGLPFEYEVEEKTLCGNCVKLTPFFSHARYVCLYDDKTKKLIFDLKYKDKTFLVPSLSKMIHNIGKEYIEACDYIIPVPLHKKRLYNRKYNQSAMIAKQIAKLSNKPMFPSLLTRKKNTISQTGLSQEKRIANVYNAFSVSKQYKMLVKNAHIVLIDDVLTTGATVNACSKTLIKSGAQKIDVLTFSRTV